MTTSKRSNRIQKQQYSFDAFVKKLKGKTDELKLKLKCLLFTLIAGYIIQFVWNGLMHLFFIDGYDIHMFEAAILWLICV